MTEYPHVPSALINALSEGGTKDEAIFWLQKTWNENCALKAAANRSYPGSPEIGQSDADRREKLTRQIAHIITQNVEIGYSFHAYPVNAHKR